MTLRAAPAAGHFPARELSAVPDRPRLGGMSTFTIHDAQSAPEAARDALAALERNVGFIPNLAGTLAAAPAALQAFVATQTALRGSGLTALERETVALTVSLANACPYSMAAHSAFAAGAGASPDLLAVLRTAPGGRGPALPDARLEAVRQLAAGLLQAGGHLPGEALEAFLRAGFTTGQALEVVTQVAFTTLANLAANLAGTEVDGAFAGQAWSPAAA